METLATTGGIIGLAATPAANTLITKICDAIGVIYEPHHKVRMAKAEAKSKAILSQANAEQLTLAERACQRMVHEEVQKQLNIENIISKTLPLLKEDSQIESLDKDWIVHLFEKAKLVSDSEAQELWAKVLSAEANHSGTISKRTLNLIAELDKREAELFMKLASYTFYNGSLAVPLIFYSKENNNHLNFSNLSHLDSIGLVKFDSLSGFSLASHGKHFLRYHNKAIIIAGKTNPQSVKCGNVIYTKVGSELLKLFTSDYSDNIFKNCFEMLKSKNEKLDISVDPNLHSALIF